MASAACMKTAVVPVEFKVATIFCAMFALLPMPETTTLPFELSIKLTTFSKSSVKRFFNPNIELASVSMTCVAISLIFLILKKKLIFSCIFNIKNSNFVRAKHKNCFRQDFANIINFIERDYGKN